MPFQPGESGNPRGRPVGSGSGRSKALAALDSVLSDQSTLERMQAAFQAEFNKNPVRFFREIIMPLLPRDARLAVFNNPGPVQWTSLTEAMSEGRADGNI